MQNPFQYGKVVSDPYFTDRETEFSELITHVENRHNLVLYSPRRYGKTSLLHRVAGEMKHRGYGIIIIDFMQVTSRESFIRLYTQNIFRNLARSPKTLLKKLAKLVSGLRPAVEVDAFGNTSLSVSMGAAPVPSQSLEDVLNLTENLDPKKKWLVIFDEFQEILKLNGDSFTDLLRSVIQHHQRTAYVFCGSRYHLLLELFTSPKHAFYRFGKLMQLNKIAAENMMDYLKTRFQSTGMEISPELLERIIEAADNIPNYVQFIAAELWQLCVTGNREPNSEILAKALENVLDNQSDYFMQIWDGLSLQQKKLLQAVAVDQGNLFSAEYHQKHQLGAVSSTQRAMQKLLSDQIISKTEGIYWISDPLFKQFILLRRSA